MKPLTILVVEDDALQGMVLGEILEEIGHKVCAVTSTVSGAVAAMATYRPALLIVDAWLKDGSGLSVVDKVCRYGHVPHLYATGDILRIQLARPEAVVIQKPYHIVEMVAAIERAMLAEPPSAG